MGSFAVGNKMHLFDGFLDDNPGVQLHTSEYVNAPHIIAQNRNVVSVNSAVEVDVTGQVCADSVGSTIISGVGGQLDFVVREKE